MKSLKISFFLALIFSVAAVAQNKQNTINEVRHRQVHLDFHTSELIPEIGNLFNKEQWQNALKTGHVNQINIFAKCHHSWSYYPTKVGRMHPHLTFDLLGAQIESCHEIGVRCPIYFTVGWSANDAETHPEWCARKKDGEYLAMNWNFTSKLTDRKPDYSWKWLCAASGGPYNEHVKKQVEEICQNYPVDGFWFDIYHVGDLGCYCSSCIKRMKREGIDLNDEKAVQKSTAMAIKAHMQELRNLVAKYYPNATAYFNATPHVRDTASFLYRLYDLNTQQELEDLPTAWGGYDKLPYEAKYHLSQGSKIIAMSGKFHKAWGEFGGFKHPDAIKYEAAAMISYGASCNFGDQLHPSGEMDMDTYKNIGEAYQYIEQIEDYGPGGFPVSRLGMWLTLKKEADLGLVNMLLEMHYDFVIADENSLEKIELLIIPSYACLSGNQAEKIANWVKRGGKLIVFGEGALNKEKSDFIMDVGAQYIEKSPYQFDYTVLSPAIGKNLVESPFLNYESALKIKPTDAKILASIREPYFNRTYQHFSSHRETPYKLEETENPAIVQKGNVIYFAHHLDQLYYNHAVRIHRDLVKNAIDLLYERPMLKVENLPSCGRVSLLKQENNKRYIAHLLYAPALQRGEVMVLEDFVPISNVHLEIAVPEKVDRVYQIPVDKEIEWKMYGKKLEVKIPAFTMHTGIVVEYK
ncbi:MAG: hypothetical protein JW731_09345 [Bacteroidales bacterium]|nr:hypothetical protein [Bacteroidales bacterium]